MASSTGSIRLYEPDGSPAGGTLIPTAVSDKSEPEFSYVGDLNADGVLDFVVSAPNSAGGEITLGTTGATISSTPTGDMLGSSLAAVGDVNGDGKADVLLGAPGANSGEGDAYLLYGGQGSYTLPSLGGGTDGMHIDGANTGYYLGTDVSAAGDFDGDGFADFMVSEPGAGKVYLYLGGAAPSLGLTFSDIDTDTGGDIPIMDMGDVNGDGFSDIAIYDDNGGTAGVLNMYFGSASPNSTVDFSILETSGHKIISGGAIGDFDGDGYDDGLVIIDSGATTAGGN